MPQLSIETFVSQYLWFISILLIFYFIAITQVIPRIAEIMKTRQKTAQPTDFSGISVEGNKTEKVEYNTSTIFSNISKNILLNDEALKHTSLSASEKELKKASELWVKKNI